MRIINAKKVNLDFFYFAFFFLEPWNEEEDQLLI